MRCLHTQTARRSGWRCPIVLSVLSVMLGLAPFYCMYRLICLFVAGEATAALVVRWCLWSFLAYALKIVLFCLSTGVSHAMAYTILKSLRLRLADRFLHAPLGNVENRSIGEIKTMMVDKIENLEPPLAHMIPEGAGHVVLPIVSIIALLCVDWRLALASLVTFPLSIVCMSGSVKTTSDTLKTLETMPIWAFVGEDDVVVKPESTETFIESVSEQNSDARVTVFEATDHVGVLQKAWLENGKALLNWLLQ